MNRIVAVIPFLGRFKDIFEVKFFQDGILLYLFKGSYSLDMKKLKGFMLFPPKENDGNILNQLQCPTGGSYILNRFGRVAFCS